MLKPAPYILRYEINGKDEYVTIDRFDKTVFDCGLVAGDQVRVTRDIIERDAKGNPTGDVMVKGEIHAVLIGSSDDPTALPLRKPGGELHMWDDNESVWESFARVPD